MASFWVRFPLLTFITIPPDINLLNLFCRHEHRWKDYREKFYQGTRRPIPVPLASGAFVKACTAFLYSGQYIDATATVIRFRNRLLYWQLAYASLELLQKTLRAYFCHKCLPATGPGYDVPLVTPLLGPAKW